ncbi:MAG TPA: hypothetical protein DCK98_14630 [Chloroflexi bacterium]|nr:hypothetical protein [Chloroflexota bacterium]HAL28695.1 hypothetical protein [Chloroflexota bacterium]
MLPVGQRASSKFGPKRYQRLFFSLYVLRCLAGREPSSNADFLAATSRFVHPATKSRRQPLGPAPLQELSEARHFIGSQEPRDLAVGQRASYAVGPNLDQRICPLFAHRYRK